MTRIEERLEAMQVDTSEMTTEQKFTAATGLTHYDEETAANDWYVPKLKKRLKNLKTKNQ